MRYSVVEYGGRRSSSEVGTYRNPETLLVHDHRASAEINGRCNVLGTNSPQRSLFFEEEAHFCVNIENG
jgi:hypothetical protein